MDDLRLGVLGGGSWGTTVASLVTRNAPVKIWARSEEVVREINEQHTNERYLPGIRLPEKLVASHDIGEVASEADVLAVAIPSQNFRGVMETVHDHVRAGVPIISLTKGLEAGTRKRMTEVVADVLPGHPVGVLTGPNLAREIMEGRAAASVLAVDGGGDVEVLRKLFYAGLFRVYSNEDVVGCELGGVLKNIIAIAVGMGDGLGAGANTRAGLITRGLAEITRLGVALGGRKETFSGLAGMGDLIATCTSDQSRNRRVGLELAKGKTIEEVTREMTQVAEGVKTAPVVMELARERDVSMPIAEDVYKVVIGESTAQRAFRGLLRVSAGAESEPG